MVLKSVTVVSASSEDALHPVSMHESLYAGAEYIPRDCRCLRLGDDRLDLGRSDSHGRSHGGVLGDRDQNRGALDGRSRGGRTDVDEDRGSALEDGLVDTHLRRALRRARVMAMQDVGCLRVSEASFWGRLGTYLSRGHHGRCRSYDR